MGKIILCDIDGTICFPDIKNEDSHLYPTAEVIKGSREQLNKWYDEGLWKKNWRSRSSQNVSDNYQSIRCIV